MPKDRNGIPKLDASFTKATVTPEMSLAAKKVLEKAVKAAEPPFKQTGNFTPPTGLADPRPINRTTDVLRVSATSLPASVAGAIAGALRERGRVELQGIGAGAINQAVKAIAIARGYVAPIGMDLICIPAFVNVEMNGEERTAISFIIEPRNR